MVLVPGQKINHFVVIELHHQDKRWRRHWLCKCRCGKQKVVQGSLLTSGNTKSCGCWSKEAARLRSLPHGVAARNQVFAGYRHKAKKSGMPFSITQEQFGRIAAQPCFYCGSLPSNVGRSQNGTGDFVYSGIDKIDPRRGYTVSNTVSCCHICNFAKSNRSQGEFISWIRRTYEHLRKNAMADQWG
jgi:hypothetical protein